MDYISKRLAEERVKNVLKFKMDYTDPSIIKKLKGIGKRYGFSKPYDLEAIDFFVKENFMAMIYGIDANKQTRHEKWALELLQTKFDDVSLLKKKSVMIDSGIVIQADDAILIGRGVDFVIHYKSYSIYALHVYTTGGGGSQDSCYREVIKFIEKALPIDDSGDLVVAILLDGDYYIGTRLDYLRKKFQSSRVIISDTPDFIKNIDCLLQ